MGSHLTAETLLGDLRGDGYRVEVEGGRLYLEHPTRRQPPSAAVLAAVARHRNDLVRLLTPSTDPPRATTTETTTTETPMQRQTRLEAAAVAHRLNDPAACPCGQCAREDAAGRWQRQEGRWGFRWDAF